MENKSWQIIDELCKAMPCASIFFLDDEQMTVVSANKYFYKMLGYSDESADSSDIASLIDIIEKDDMPLMCAALHNDRMEVELRFRSVSGVSVWGMLRAVRTDRLDGCFSAVLEDVTQLYQTRENLRVAKEEYRVAIRHSEKTVYSYDIATKIGTRQSDSSAAQKYDKIIENMPQTIVEAGYIEPDSVADYLGLFDQIEHGEQNGVGIIRLLTIDGKRLWSRMDYSVVFSDMGKPLRALISFQNITERRDKEMLYGKWHKSYDSQSSNDMTYYEYNLTADRVERETGNMLKPIPKSVNHNLSEVISYFAAEITYCDDRHRIADFFSRDRLLDAYKAGVREDSIEFRRKDEQGKPLWTMAEISLSEDPASQDIKCIVVNTDIEEFKREQLLMEAQMHNDSLTGLLNRATFIEKLEHKLNKSGPGDQHAFIMVDVDNFKTVNDTLGHAFGDTVLSDYASELRAITRSGDIIGRLGGDEFALLVSNIPAGNALSRKARALCSVLEKKFSCGISTSASMGIVTFPADGSCFEELYKKADIALYEAKKLGRNRFVFYQPYMQMKSDASSLETPIDSIGSVPHSAAKSVRVKSAADVQLEALLNHMIGGVMLVEVGALIRAMYISSSYYKLTGLTIEEMRRYGDDLTLIVHPDDAPAMERALRETAAGGPPTDFTYRAYCAGKTFGWRHMRAVKIPYNASDLPVLILETMDVTQARRDSMMMQSILKNMPCGVGIYEHQPDGRQSLVYANSTLFNIMGLHQDDFDDKGVIVEDARSTVDPKDLPDLMEMSRRVVREKIVDECFYSSADTAFGKKRWMLARCVPFETESGKPAHLGMLVDVTSQKKLSTELEIQREQMRMALEISGVTVFTLDTKSRVIRRTITIDADYALGDALIQDVPNTLINSGFYTADSIDSIREMYGKAFAGEDEVGCVVSVCAKGGGFIKVRIALKKMPGVDDTMIGTIEAI